MKKKKIKVKAKCSRKACFAKPKARQACSAKWTANKFVNSVWGVMKKQEKEPSIKLLHKKLEEDIMEREKK